MKKFSKPLAPSGRRAHSLGVEAMSMEIKTGKTVDGEVWRETPAGVFRVYTVGGSQAHAELHVRRKDGWHPHYRNPCEGPFLVVLVEALRREKAIAR